MNGGFSRLSPWPYLHLWSEPTTEEKTVEIEDLDLNESLPASGLLTPFAGTVAENAVIDAMGVSGPTASVQPVTEDQEYVNDSDDSPIQARGDVADTDGAPVRMRELRQQRRWAARTAQQEEEQLAKAQQRHRATRAAEAGGRGGLGPAGGQ